MSLSLTNPPRTVQVPAKHKDKTATALQAALHVNDIFIHSAGANLIHKLWTAGIYLCMWSVQASGGKASYCVGLEIVGFRKAINSHLNTWCYESKHLSHAESNVLLPTCKAELEKFNTQ